MYKISSSFSMFYYNFLEFKNFKIYNFKSKFVINLKNPSFVLKTILKLKFS